jgi:transposase
VFGDRPRARILIEASTDSEWVARCLEALGHEVIIADPNFAPMYATRSRKVKSDRRDARALAEACRLGAYRPAHRLSDPQRHVRGHLGVRDALVHTRTPYISVIRAPPAAPRGRRGSRAGRPPAVAKDIETALRKATLPAGNSVRQRETR